MADCAWHLQGVFGVGDRVKLIGARAAAHAAPQGSKTAIFVVSSTYPLTADARQRGIIITPLGGGLGSRGSMLLVAAADIAFAHASDEAPLKRGDVVKLRDCKKGLEADKAVDKCLGLPEDCRWGVVLHHGCPQLTA